MKTKQTTSFVCQECGYDSPKFLGKCPECGMWNTLKEIHLGTNVRGKTTTTSTPIDVTPKVLSEIHYEEKQRMPTGFVEMDGVFGGGIVAGSVTLLAGDPGIGKSTLLLQVALNMAAAKGTASNAAAAKETRETKGTNGGETFGTSVSFTPSVSSVLYISAEESEEQIKLRATRINSHAKDSSLLLISLTDTDRVVSLIEQIKPSLVVIDSIQTMESENAGGLSGSVGQIRYATSQFVRAAKTLRIPIILVGHVTKEGMVAGPMTLSHMVDTVLFLEGERFTRIRLLRSLKNRFGPIDEVGVFAMEEQGMIQVTNPEQIFLTENKTVSPGSVLTVVLEGTRAFLVELQALVVFSKLPFPRRIASGIDSRRLELLLAVLQKHCRLPLETMDVFVNVAGGLKVADPAADLGVCLAVLSSFKNIALPKTVGVAEVGLLGELRNVGGLEKRIKEAKKLGFEKILTAKTHRSIGEVLASIGK